MRSFVARTLFAAWALLGSGALLAAEGRLVIKGSDTIGGALGPDLAEAYFEENPGVPIDWEALGSSTAFVGLLDGSAQLGAASRPVSENELAEAKRLGLELKEWVIGYDGIAVLVHAENPLPRLTLAQAAEIFQGKIKNFRKVGGPDRPIHLISRPSYSGTHVFFRDRVLRRGNSKGPEDFAAETRFVEHSAEVARLVAEDPGAIAYLGLGWVKPGTRVVPLAASGSSAGILPSTASVRDGSYPLFRALYLYSRGEPSGAARNLLGFILSRKGQAIVARNGFVSVDSPVLVSYAPSRIGSPRRPPETRLASVAGPVAAPPASPPPLAEPSSAGSEPAPPQPAGPIRIFFGSAGIELRDEAVLQLEHAASLLQAGALQALVMGHADAQGSTAANQRLSEARARAVAAALEGLGIAPGLLTVEGRGASEPLETNATARGRSQNRRVDILLVPVAPR